MWAPQELGYIRIQQGDRTEGKRLMDAAAEIDNRRNKQLGAAPYVPVRTSSRQRARKQWWKKMTLEKLERGTSL